MQNKPLTVRGMPDAHTLLDYMLHGTKFEIQIGGRPCKVIIRSLTTVDPERSPNLLWISLQFSDNPSKVPLPNVVMIHADGGEGSLSYFG